MSTHGGGNELLRPETTGERLIANGLLEVVERSPVGIAVVEADTQVICYANPAFRHLCRSTGDEGESIVGQTIARVVPPPGADRLAALLMRTRDSGEPECDIEVEQIGHGDEAIHWSITIWQLPTREGRRGDLVVQVRDITDDVRERRRQDLLVDQLRDVNERLLMASLREQDLTRKAEAANEAKSDFLATMSHELRTPLTAILGYEELLADGITGPVSESQRAQLARIKQSANHLLGLIDQVLTMARIEADGEVTRNEPVNVAEMVNDVTMLIAPLAARKSIVFTVRLPEHALTLNTDVLKARQILVNLCGNAIKFTDSGEVALTVRESDHTVFFEIRDTGIGIRPADMPHIFDPFWQAEQKPTRRVGGSGLGLSVSSRLAHLLGGKVAVESELGRGSTFTLELPRDRRHAATSD